MSDTASPAQASGPANIALAKVIYVNPREFTVDALGIFTHRTYTDIPFATTYQNALHAGGVSIMPEVDSMCYVCTCADKTQFVLGFVTDPRSEPQFEKVDGKIQESTTAEPGPSFRGQRDFLEPGDVYLGTQDGNKVCLRRGGMVQIGSTSLAQRFYLPIENVVRDYFQKYQAFSPVGEIEWGHAQLVGESDLGEKTSIGGVVEAGEANTKDTPVIVRYSIKDVVQEVVSGKTDATSPAGSSGHRNYTLEVRFGRLTDEALDTEEDNEHIFGNARTINEATNSDVGLRQFPGLKDDHVEADDATWGVRSSRGVLSFTIWPHDDAEGGPASKEKVTYAFQLNKDGDQFLHSKGHIHVELDRTVYANVAQGVKIEYGDELSEQISGSTSKQALLELTKNGELQAYLEQMVVKVINDFVFDGKKFMINATDTDGIELGVDPSSHGVKFEELKDCLVNMQNFINNELILLTAWGPTPPGAKVPCTAIDSIDTAKSSKVLVE